MNETIYDILKNANVPQGAAELTRLSGLSADEVLDAASSLLREGRITLTKKGKYAIPERLGQKPGWVSFSHNGTPIFHADDGSAGGHLINHSRMRVLPGDRVMARIEGEEIQLYSILEKKNRSIAACIRIQQGKSRRGRREIDHLHVSAVPCDPRIPYKIDVRGDTSFLRNNEIALLRITDYPSGDFPIIAEPVRVLGNANSLLARMRATAEQHGFPTEFPDEVETAAAALRRKPFPEADEARRDLRALTLFTIDGASSKDFDDAVSIEEIPSGFRLGVHIADVSHYVRPGSAIDREALARGTSLYLPGCTVPMLPEVLSNDLCSLMPDQDRLAMSLFMDVNEKGRVVDHLLTPSVIRSKARLTYDGVNRFFGGSDEPIPDAVSKSLLKMRALAEILRKRRKERGAIDFEMEEAQFVLNEKYEPTEIICPRRGESERLIEDFMLLANETVARLARDTMLPFLYRIHEEPDSDRIHALEEFLNLAGAPAHLGETPHPGILQRILDDHAEDEYIDVLRRHMLRALKKAQYSEKPAGHYALSMADYCHFTSPIRRYPDLIVHRMLKLLLTGGDASRWEARMPALAAECSAREQESVRAERDTEAMLKAAWMSKQLGRKFYGAISGVTGWGVYVTLPNTVEGLVHVSDMDDFYNYDANRQQLIGSSTGAVLKIGMKVRVRAIDASITRGEINFELLEV